MFTCAWCKKETNGHTWTKDKEPLCSDECEAKYYFGLNRGMFSGKASELSKEKRREVSERVHVFENFYSVMSHIKREELAGQFKKFYIIGCLLIFVAMSGLYVLTGLLVNRIVNYPLIAIIFNFGVLFTYCVAAIKIKTKLEWYLKFLQLKKDCEYRDQH